VYASCFAPVGYWALGCRGGDPELGAVVTVPWAVLRIGWWSFEFHVARFQSHIPYKVCCVVK